MSLNTVTVTGHFEDAAQQAATGFVTFTPSAVLTDATDDRVIAPIARTYNLVGGAFTSDPLIATDNTNLSPSNWVYAIEVVIENQDPYSFTCYIPHTPSPVDITALTLTGTPQSNSPYLLLSGGTLTGELTLDGSPTSLVVADGLQIPTGAAIGDVLTSDASGNATWQSGVLASPSAWWQLADAVGSSTAADSSGNDQPGAATDVTFGVTGPSQFNTTAASFPGPTGPSGILTTFNPTGFTALTLEAWINLDGQAQTGNPRLLTNSHTDSGSDLSGFELQLASGTTPRINIGNGTTQTQVTASSVTNNAWHYLAATWNGTTISLYVDGVLKSSGALSGTLAKGKSTGVSIGYDADYNGDYFTGYMAQVMISAVALSANQIQARYAGILPAPQPSIVPAWGSALATWTPVLPSGDTTGATDQANIQNALNSAAQGQNVFLASGTFYINAPIVFPSTEVSLCGQEGCTQGGAGSPGVGTIVRPTAGFTSAFTTDSGNMPIWAAVILGKASRQNVQDLWVHGDQLPTTTLAAGSNGGNPASIATWTSPSAGVLDVASTTGFPATGAANVQTSFGTARIAYTGTTSTSLTGCTYLAGYNWNQSGNATVATGNAVAVLCDGIVNYSSSSGHSIHRVGINNMTGWGFNGANVSGSGGTPEGVLWDTMIIQGCMSGGLNGGSTDCVVFNVHGQNNNWVQISAGVTIIGCRADGDGLVGSIGFAVSGFNAGPGVGRGDQLIGCSTENNDLWGLYVSGGGDATYGPVQAVGCAFTGDGSNNGAGGYPAIYAVGRVQLSLTDVNVAGGGSGNSITFPEYTLGIAKNVSGYAPDIVTARGGVWQAATAFTSIQSGIDTIVDIGADVYGIIGAINGTGGGNTPYVQVQDIEDDTALVPSGDTTGATDSANIQAEVATNALIELGPGEFYISQPIVVKQTGVTIFGQGNATVLNVASGFSDPNNVTPSGMLLPAVFQLGNLDSSGNNCTITSLVIQGQSATVTSNPGATGINNAGCSGVRTTELTLNNLNGWGIEAMSGSGGSHEVNRCFYHDMLIVNCAGNIHLNGQGYTVNSVMSDINCPSSGVTTGPAANLDGIHLDHCDDVVMTNVNPGNGNSGSAWHMTNVAAIWLTSSDYSGGSAGPGMLIDGSSSGVTISDAVISGGTVGLSITGSTQNVRIMDCAITVALGDGADVTATGGGIVFQNCYFGQGYPGNGSGATGTNYDLNWSGTATGTVTDCTFNSPIVSTGTIGVQYSVNIAADQKVVFDSVRFLGSGASSSNWFTNYPSAVMRTDSGVFDFRAGLSVRGTPHPGLFGLASWTVDPVACGTNQFQLGTAGTGYGSVLQVPSWATISKLYMVLATAGATLTSGQCFGAVYNSAGTLIGYTGDESSAWAGSQGLLTMSLTAESTGSLTLSPGSYWIAAYANGTTLPKFMSCAGSPYFAAVNAGLSGSTSRAATLFTGASSTIPTTCTFSAGGILLWGAVA